MPKRKRAAAIKSGYASAVADSSWGSDVDDLQLTARKRNSNCIRTPPAPSISSPCSSRGRTSSHNTIDDARIAKQAATIDICLGNPNRFNILKLPDDLLYHMIKFIASPQKVDIETFSSLQATCKRFRKLANASAVWSSIPVVLSDGSLNMNALGFIKLKGQGTEGSCLKVYCRRTQREMALKRARVYRDNEGVPYYMMRELSALKKLNHPNICELETVSLHEYKLYLLFPYIEKTLHDYLNAAASGGSGSLLKPHQTKNIMKQLLAAVSYCHERCIMHRNLKPKHLLIIPGPGPDPLDEATVKLADFALVRVLVHPPRQYTTEVITLWYRPPEILLGQRNYSTAVDMWSVGCIFAELIDGKPIFSGLCEIDQLFQIFQKLGTPASSVWPSCESLPHFQPIFPRWEQNRLSCFVKGASCAQIELLSEFLRYDPTSRISAASALERRYFREEGASLMLPPPPPAPKADALRCLYSGYSKPRQSITFSGTGYRPICFDVSGLEGVVSVSPIVLRQYLYLRHLEGDAVYQRPYFGRGSSKDLSSLSMDAAHSGFLFRESDTLCVHRMEMVDSLIEIMDSISLHMCVRTVFFAVAIFDRYLSYCDEPPEELFSEYELIGSTCLHIASKCEDVSYISVKDLAVVSRNIQEGAAILKMEEVVLNKLGFDLYIPCVIDFVGFFIDCLPGLAEDQKPAIYARYISELSLMYPSFLAFPTSMVATAVVSYSLLCCRMPIWPSELRKLSMYDADSIIVIVLMLNRIHSRVLETVYRGIYERYSGGVMPYNVAMEDAPVLRETDLPGMFSRSGDLPG